MLRFLLIHVRSLSRDGQRLPVLDDSTGGKAGSGPLPPPGPSNSPYPLQPDDAPTAAHPRPRPRGTFRPLTGSHQRNVLMLLLLIGASCEIQGCACLRREALEANIVSARQLSLQGI